MKQTAVELLIEQLTAIGQLEIPKGSNAVTLIIEQAKAMEKIENLKRQLFIGKVSEIIGFDKTIELLKECNETFKSE